jgi:hypothetical protein
VSTTFNSNLFLSFGCLSASSPSTNSYLALVTFASLNRIFIDIEKEKDKDNNSASSSSKTSFFPSSSYSFGEIEELDEVEAEEEAEENEVLFISIYI